MTASIKLYPSDPKVCSSIIFIDGESFYGDILLSTVPERVVRESSHPRAA